MNRTLTKNVAVLICATFTGATTPMVYAQSGAHLYNQVQDIYMRYSSIPANDCSAVKSLLSDLSAYKRYTQAVPADKAYSVNFKRRVTNPTIAHLVEDRTARVESSFRNCSNTVNDRAVELYNRVQKLYLTAPRRQVLTASDCRVVESVIARLERYAAHTEYVPAQWIYTVAYPHKKSKPSIADLVKDRTERLKQVSVKCASAATMSTYVLENLPGTYRYDHKGRKFQLTIDRHNNNLSAAYTGHQYSYPPVYKGAEQMTTNKVRFSFLLGGRHQVEIDVAHNSPGISAEIYESWEGTARTSVGVISSGAATNRNSREQSADGSVKVSFTNSTAATVQVYWVNGKGEEVKYYDLAAGRSYVQPTYNRHRWRFRQEGKLLLDYTANNFKTQDVSIN